MYVFEASGNGKENKIVGRVYRHKKGTGFNILIGGRRYSAFAPKVKAPVPTATPTTEGKGA
jgi:hypothetical protein